MSIANAPGRWSTQVTSVIALNQSELSKYIAELKERAKTNPLLLHVLMPMQKEFKAETANEKYLYGGNRELAYGTLVRMSDGSTKRIEDIKIGDGVLSWNGTSSVPSVVVDIPYDGISEAYKATTKFGLEVISSIDHCFPSMCSSTGGIMKHTLKEIRDCKWNRKQFVSSGKQVYIKNEKIPFSGLLLGLFLGDGSFGMSPSTMYPRPNFTNKDVNILNLFRSEIEKYYPELKSNSYPSDKTRLYIRKPRGLKNQNRFIKDLKGLNLTVKCNEKFIPSVFKTSDISTRIGVLTGLILTDGCVDRDKTCIYSTSLRLLEDVQDILVSLGARGKIYVDGVMKNESQKQAYVIQLSNKFIFSIGINGLLRKTPKRRSLRKPKRFDLIVDKVERVGNIRCRCLKVSHPSHTFVLANGIVTFNSGKTETVADEVINYAIRNEARTIWVAGTTFNDSVEIQQAKIYSLLPLHLTEYCRYNEIIGFSNRKVQFKNGTIIHFKSYDQGVDAFQGKAVDYIWCDEEPPIEIYRECKMRLVDRNGRLIISMTSLKGVTALIEEVFEGYNAIRTEYAPLIKKDLPRIAEKNGRKIYFLWSTENKHIDNTRLEQEVKMMSEQEITCRIYGMPINLSGRVYPKFNTDVHVVPHEDIEIENCQIWNVVDPHDRKPWAIAWFAVSKTGHSACIAEYPDRNFNEMLYDDKTYDEYSEIIKGIEAGILQSVKNKTIKRIIDPNFGNKTMQLAERQGGQAKTTPKMELKKRGLVYQDGIDALEAGHMQVREWLHWEVKDGQYVVSPKLIISDTCQNVIRHLSRYSRKDIYGSDGDAKDKVGVKEGHKDYCFVSGTMVRTPEGQKRIESVRVGDIVVTDTGIGIVSASMKTGDNRPTVRVIFDNGKELVGTPGHGVYLKNGIKIPLDLLRYGDMLSSWSDNERTIGRLVEAGIINSVQGFSTERCGSHILVRYQSGRRFIIKTETNLTTIYRILRRCLFEITGGFILVQKRRLENYLNQCARDLNARIKWLHGIEAKKEEWLRQGRAKGLGRIASRLTECVSTAVQHSKQKYASSQNSVQITASHRGEENCASTSRQERVQSAVRNSTPISIQKQDAARDHAPVVIKVEQNSPKTVYNITVVGRHRYYANDILVSNCDLVRYYVMAAPRYIEQQYFETDETRRY